MDIVFPDQFFDRTRHRVSTFFGGGIAAHVTFADPVVRDLADTLEQAARAELKGSIFIAAAPISAWKARPFRPEPSRRSIALGECPSSE